MLAGLWVLATLLAVVTSSPIARCTAPTVRSFNVTGGHTYSYTVASPSNKSGTFLLLHGFPSSSYDWRHTIADLTGEGWGVIAPDLLGYGGTSKPIAVEEYAKEKISSHVAEILQHEGISKVIGVGHDWGAGLLSTMWYYHPQFFKSLAFLTVPYSPVGPNPINVTAINARTKAAFGYPIYGYWPFFNETGAANAIEAHESFTSLLYPKNATIWKTNVCQEGKLKEWIEADKRLPIPPYMTYEEWKIHNQILLDGGYTGPLNWYKAAMAGLDKSPTLEPARQAINRRVIFISGAHDAVGRPDLAQQTAEEGRKSGLLPNVEAIVLPNSGHWVQIEQRSRVSTILKGLGV